VGVHPSRHCTNTLDPKERRSCALHPLAAHVAMCMLLSYLFKFAYFSHLIHKAKYNAEERPVFADIARELHVLSAGMGEEI